MSHPYPPHDPKLPYKGTHDYFLTFRTYGSRKLFTAAAKVDLVWSQFLRASGEQGFELTAYCFMTDHLHALIRGQAEESDCKAFIKAAKQYSGFYFKQKHHHELWQRYGYEWVVRDHMERALVIGYIVTNPVEAGLVGHPAEYPFLGSERYSVEELLQICEYKGESSA
jgi:REP element-mobilizing transposase RayT